MTNTLAGTTGTTSTVIKRCISSRRAQQTEGTRPWHQHPSNSKTNSRPAHCTTNPGDSASLTQQQRRKKLIPYFTEAPFRDLTLSSLYASADLLLFENSFYCKEEVSRPYVDTLHNQTFRNIRSYQTGFHCRNPDLCTATMYLSFHVIKNPYIKKKKYSLTHH